MAKTTKSAKDKTPVRIRFQELSNGNKSVYLDIYKEGKRTREFLKMYIIPERRPVDRTQNEQTMNAVRHIQAQRVMALNDGKAGIQGNSRKAKLLLSDWIKVYMDERDKKGLRGKATVEGRLKRIIEYGADVALKDIDKAYCLGFIDFLRNKCYSKRAYKTDPERRLSLNSIANTYDALKAILNAAVRAEIITANPCYTIEFADRPKHEETAREYLTIDEVKKLIDTPYNCKIVKTAFLFACFCGLRYSDVKALKWENISVQNGTTCVNVVMQKTGMPIYLPLSKSALAWLPERGAAKPTDPVFEKLPANNCANLMLLRWAKHAGITKRISFHTSRHTFATTSLTLGVDLYTTSKLLGHSKVTTTQVYAKIINSKKEEAVSMFDNVFASADQKEDEV